MADLQDDRKKEEEEYGGFEPDENDDESFMLEDENEYPAKLPDNFGEIAQQEQVSSAINDETVNQIDEEPKEEEPSQDDSEEQYEPEIDEEITIAEADIEEADEEVQTEEIPQETEEDEELDEDFKRKLQEDIERSKAKREANEESFDQPHQTAKPIGDDADTVVMLNDIEADKPSNYRESDNIVEQMPIEGHVAENLEGDIEDDEVEFAEEPKEKNRKTPVWIMMLYSSVATFLVTVIAMWLIWAFMSDTSDDLPGIATDSTAIADKSMQEHNQPKQPINNNISKEENNWLDSVDMDKGDTVLRTKEDKEFFSELLDGDDYDDIPEKELEKQQEKPAKANNKLEEPKKKEATKKVEKKTEKNNIASNDVTSTKENIPKQSSIKVDDSKFSMPQPKGPVPEVGTFTVQIYSSPSREDAENWLGQLKAQQVPNAVITEQEIKGRTWYRVRYGNFETKEQARASALELGYSQSWIDRIK